MNPVDLPVVGAVGQWVSAILATAGLYAQSKVYETFEGYLVVIGSLFFLFAIISAVVQVALYGQYRLAAYLLVAPGLFFWMLFHRTEVSACDYKFGYYTIENPTERIMRILRDDGGDYYDGPASVSWFFARYDSLVSYLAQKMVATLVETDMTQEDNFLVRLARERMIIRVARARGANPHFLKLLSISLLNKCSSQFKISAEISASGRSADDQLSVIAQASNVLPGDNLEDLQLKTAHYESMRQQPIHLETPLQQYLLRSDFDAFRAASGMDPTRPVTCHEVWQALMYSAYLGAEAQFTPMTIEQNQYEGLNWDFAVADVREKIGDSPFFSGGGAILPGVGGSEDELSALALAPFYLRNTLTYAPLGEMAIELDHRGTWNEPAYRFDYSEVAQHEGGAYRMMFVQFVAYLPYMHGIVLFFLSMAFPFFALLLLIPGKHSSFFIWLSLWAWAKSWDVGFAMVHAMREVLWNLLPSFAAERELSNFRDISFDSPGPVLSMAFENDPISQIDLYYFVVAMLTISVPAVTAQMFYGASFVYRAIRTGLEHHPQSDNQSKNQDNQSQDTQQLAQGTQAQQQLQRPEAARGLPQSEASSSNLPIRSGGNSQTSLPSTSGSSYSSGTRASSPSAPSFQGFNDKY